MLGEGPTTEPHPSPRTKVLGRQAGPQGHFGCHTATVTHARDPQSTHTSEMAAVSSELPKALLSPHPASWISSIICQWGGGLVFFSFFVCGNVTINIIFRELSGYRTREIPASLPTLK